jgi:hypothetical protein
MPKNKIKSDLTVIDICKDSSDVWELYCLGMIDFERYSMFAEMYDNAWKKHSTYCFIKN